MKYTPDDYLSYDPFEGDMDVDIRCRQVRLLRTRTPHACTSIGESEHIIEPGSMARFEKAFVDRSHWGSYYTCINCLDKWLDEVIGPIEQDGIEDELLDLQPVHPYRCDRTADIFGGIA